MSNKTVKEWFVEALWGKIALISWGNPNNPPVLLVHGYLDTAATFSFLVDKLPDDHYYVAFDMPGHGKSESFPPGILVTKFHIVESLRVVVEHMEWKSVTFMSHSMGSIIGLYYNHFYPGIFNKMIFLDPKPSFGWYYVMDYETPRWYEVIFTLYYDNYEKFNFGKQKPQTYESWLSSLSRQRKLTEEQSKVMLSRTLVPTEGNKYILSREMRAKTLGHIPVPIETVLTIITKYPLPTLVINASDYPDFVKNNNAMITAKDILDKCENQCEHFNQVTATGNHDFHINNPDSIVSYIEEFLKSDRGRSLQKSKL